MIKRKTEKLKSFFRRYGITILALLMSSEFLYKACTSDTLEEAWAFAMAALAYSGIMIQEYRILLMGYLIRLYEEYFKLVNHHGTDHRNPAE